jgi:23S rRNA pseudouridine1911/1915/1917 synthase
MYKNVEVIYEDKEVVVCRKLSGVPVHTPRLGQQDMVSLLRNYFAVKGEENTQIFVVHRLDQPVEGIMVFARNKQAAANLSRQSRERSMDKCYLALVEGTFAEASGVLEDYLWQDKETNTSSVVAQGTPGAKHAMLRYQVEKVVKPEEAVSRDETIPAAGKMDNGSQETGSLAGCQKHGGERSLVRVWLETGRHHQIRVQMAYAGHPIVGDRKYNPGSVQGFMPVGLCAVKIAFVHPVTGRRMEFSVEPQGKLFRVMGGHAERI